MSGAFDETNSIRLADPEHATTQEEEQQKCSLLR